MTLEENLKKYQEKVKQNPLTSVIITIVLLLFLLIVVPYVDISLRGINNATIEATLENQSRATLAQIFGGVAIGIGLYYTWRRISIAEEDLKATKEGQITERFTRAVDQLGAVDKDGNPAIEIRLGGIYALERIANESEKDYWPIIEILTAYVRKNSPLVYKNVNNEDCNKSKNLSLDIQAIVTVIRRCKPSPINKQGFYQTMNIESIKKYEDYIAYDNNYGFKESHRLNIVTANLAKEADFLVGAVNYIDLHETCLGNVNLFDAYLVGANFQRANLEGANLYKANLYRSNSEKVNFRKAILINAELNRAFLMGAHFEKAELFKARIIGSFLTDSYLEDATLRKANLENSFFIRAHLENANLEEADLRGANLLEVNFEGANLKGAKNLTVDQLSKVKSLYKAQLDEGLEAELRGKGFGYLLDDEPEDEMDEP